MHAVASEACLLFGLAAAAACQRVDVRLELNFPSNEAFSRVETIDLFAVPIDTHEQDHCPQLLGEALAGEPDGAMLLVDSMPSCRWLEPVHMAAPDGAHAFVAVLRDARGQTLLYGCNISGKHMLNRIRVTLTPTATMLIAVRSEIEHGTRPVSTPTPEQTCAMRGLP